MSKNAVYLMFRLEIHGFSALSISQHLLSAHVLQSNAGTLRWIVENSLWDEKLDRFQAHFNAAPQWRPGDEEIGDVNQPIWFDSAVPRLEYGPS